MNPVLLIIDMQKDFFEDARLRNQQKTLVDNINYLVAELRSKNIPIIWVSEIIKSDLSNATLPVKKSGTSRVVENTEGSQLLDGLIKEKLDLEVIKTRYSSFFKTNLEDLLNELNIDTIIISGINTHACVRMTVIDAYQRDYEVIVARDCIGSWDKEHHEITLKYFEPKIARVLSTEDLLKLFE